MLPEMDFHTARAALAWQIELGADEAIDDTPVDRFAIAVAVPRGAVPAQVPAAAAVQPEDPVVEATRLADAAGDLAALRAALEEFDGCELKRGARNTVFSDGAPGARVMIIGEPPDADEDRQGKPIVGPAGKLLDRMFAAIGLGRADGSLYITNILPWRPPGDRTPEPGEIAMMMPFVRRHIALAAPDIVLPMGNISCQGLLGRQGITRLRGQWTEAAGRPALPMVHPAFLLRSPEAKREAWADLLEIQARLRGE